MKRKLKSELARISKQCGARLNEKELTEVSLVVFQVLFDIGMVLHGFA
jgi:hypothetical protein